MAEVVAGLEVLPAALQQRDVAEGLVGELALVAAAFAVRAHSRAWAALRS